MRRLLGALCSLGALALPAAADVAEVAEVPERWLSGAGVGDDRSGDVRPEAIAILDALAAARHPLTVAEIPGAPDRVARKLSPPSSIRIWRRGLDGSTSSCAGRVDVIPFEQYVRGVLPHEWIRSWDEESLKAGGVAIRTYAAAWVAAGGKYDCADLDDTTASQVYRDEFYPVTDAAVEATAGVFVVRGEDLVFAEYSAENSDPTEFGVDEPHCTGRARQGHGRGTCQWGTQRWALAGQTWEWMLPHYYPGATLVGTGPAYDASLGAQAFSATLRSGDEMVVYLEYGNAGSAAWTRDQVFVGTTGPRDRASPFFKAENWPSPSRPTAVDQATEPGQVGRFTWAMVAPEVTETTTFDESFALVNADGAWFGPADDAVTWRITVEPRDPDDPIDPGDPDPGTESGGCAAGGGAAGGALLFVALAVLQLRRARRRLMGVAAALLVLLAACAPESPRRGPRLDDPVGGDSELAAIFDEVAADSGVPAAILAATAYTQTRLAMIVPDDDGHTHGPMAWGLFALTEADLGRGAAMASVDPARVRTDPRAHTAAAAALIAAAAGTPRPDTLAGWHDALAAFAGNRDFAGDVLGHIARGFTGRDDLGRELTVSRRPEALGAGETGPGVGQITQALGYPGAIWRPASTANYAAGSRGAAQINYIVIHTVQGSYNGCISWFQNPDAGVSAHYVVRSEDGERTQMVDDSDVAWHDACFNTQSVGIEHEGYVADPDRWYTAAMYTRSAELTAWLADSYGIPKDRQHIYGHGDAPDCSDHTDPGSGWDWDLYMDLVRTGGAPSYDAQYVAMEAPQQLVSGDEAVVWFEFRNDSSVTWSISDTRLGTQEPRDRPSAFYVDGNWLGPDRPTGADHSNYGPGATGRFTFAIKAPEVTEATTFHEAFQLVQEGVAWFGPVVSMDITVVPREDPTDPTDPTDPADPSDPEDGTQTGGCAAGGAGGGAGGAMAAACAILLVGVWSRRRRTCARTRR